ncbi:MAG: putative cytosine-specific methyltransferase [Prokaryotic dsDNA virus sp.]|nr:MAG: putative cytosine-specific methyltransferase [Prokaryotic dsDNA virus sp.]|tara:strand:- start:3197 stop:4117 length:921 start_codon:yes stop_codon:yes gene_type:complete
MTHGSLFSGIGGFDLAAEWAGWKNVFHCECEPFAQKVLKHHFPKSKLYNDIKTFDATDYFGRIDIITGGFPCQPFSTAGERKGTEDERYLWKEMLRIIREVAPKYVVGENVRGLLNWSGGMVFEQVCADLEAEGYEVAPYLLPACGKNAPHRRDRIWFIAYSNNSNDGRNPRKNEKEGSKKWLQERNEVRKSTKPSKVFRTNSNTLRKRHKRHKFNGAFDEGNRTQESFEPTSELYKIPNWEIFPTQSSICGRDDGISKELDGITFSKWRKESIKAYGNAIVPQVAYEIFKSINKLEEKNCILATS